MVIANWTTESRNKQIRKSDQGENHWPCATAESLKLRNVTCVNCLAFGTGRRTLIRKCARSCTCAVLSRTYVPGILSRAFECVGARNENIFVTKNGSPDHCSLLCHCKPTLVRNDLTQLSCKAPSLVPKHRLSGEVLHQVPKHRLLGKVLHHCQPNRPYNQQVSAQPQRTVTLGSIWMRVCRRA